jgi:hypothetical protein
MPNTFTLISSITVGAGGAGTMLFSNLPTTYDDLCIKLCAQTAYQDGADAYLRFQTQANFNWRKLQGYAGTTTYGAAGEGNSASWTLAGQFTTGSFSNTEFYIPNYRSGASKSFNSDYSIENNNTNNAFLGFGTTTWTQGDAITTLLFSVASGFIEHSTAYLYGIKKS